MIIVSALERRYEYFRFRKDASGRPGHTIIQKCTATIRQLAYGGVADMFDEYLHIGETTARDCLKYFCEGVIEIFRDMYLPKPTPEDCQAMMDMHGNQHGFPRMLGSIDCMHWEWKNCPAAWKGCTRLASKEASRKDVEREFGVLQARWTAVKGPTRLWYPDCTADVMCACIIMHKMIVENEGPTLTDCANDDVDAADPSHGVATANVHMGIPHGDANRVCAFADIRQQEAHIRLQKDIIEELWTRRGAR
ncbi:uncharacterized protein LOC125209520 [Salvia hispanica]|uniref:uncharacterized protein LOC125209520 n=1 Tax=Salvia hispanica TaxID=49212 RepID=UPI0020090101|nr:uncharacterized protein LOC125209520 [Salvia hispanica]